MIIDFHTHAFPDHVAAKAVPHLEAEGDIEAHLDGTVASLYRSMDEAGIDASVVASIATKPAQFDSILAWSKEIASDRLIPFPSVHPDDPVAVDHLDAIGKEGFRGIKLHPYYQRFSLLDERMRPIFAAVERARLVLLLHTGFDLAFDRVRIADPSMIVELLRRYPGLRLVATHFGAWEDWDEVEKHLLGKEIAIDTSYSLPLLGAGRAKHFLETHPAEHILFGSDSPWGAQRAELEALRAIGLEPDRERRLLGANAEALLGR
jgi:uncharacterized protein